MPLLDGKTAIVTGGGSGLGLATARLFAQEGASVVIADVSDDAGEAAAKEIATAGGTALYRHADVRSSADLRAAVELAESSFGHLDIMVANAGILGRATFRPTTEVAEDDFDEVLEINLGGVFRSFRAAIPALQRNGGGALSASSSVSGSYASLYRVAYSASKGGINALVRSLAAELAPDRIRVNSVAPGGMTTNIGRSLGRSAEEVTVERPSKHWKSRMLWDERDRTADAAAVHLFVCSDLAAYVSGENIVADGGFSIWNGT